MGKPDNFIFISDFDCTLTEKDFYHIFIDKYLGQEARDLYKRWKNHEIKDIDFLDTIFSSVNRSEEEIHQDIINIPLDKTAIDFIQKVKFAGGEFIVLSAGTDYYISRLFDYYGVNDVKIISNKGVYADGGIHLLPDRNSPYYSDIYGVDKALVVQKYKEKQKKIYYAGDSEPDLKASLLADTIFAKGKLQELLEKSGRQFIPIKSFQEIEEYLIAQGILS